MLNIHTNSAEIAQQLRRITTDQLPFATALMLTNVAVVGQGAARSELQSVLTLRNKFSASGIQTDRANKRDWPMQVSKVGIEERRDYLIDQVLGATRKPLRSPFKGIPQTNVVPRGSSGRMPKSRRPKALLAKIGKRNGYYLVTKGSKQLLFKSQRGMESALAYVFAKTAKIEPRFKFEQAVERAVRAAYVGEFTKAIDRALSSAR